MSEFEIKIDRGISSPYVKHRIVAERPLTSGETRKLILAETWVGEDTPDWWLRFKIRRLRKRAEAALKRERVAAARAEDLRACASRRCCE